MTRTVHLRIAGRVQGVGYRAWFEDAARARALAGWVRNRRDGTVEAVISGSPEGVVEMLALAWRGPPGASVRTVSTAEAGTDALAERHGAQDFSVLPTL